MPGAQPAGGVLSAPRSAPGAGRRRFQGLDRLPAALERPRSRPHGPLDRGAGVPERMLSGAWRLSGALSPAHRRPIPPRPAFTTARSPSSRHLRPAPPPTGARSRRPRRIAQGPPAGHPPPPLSSRPPPARADPLPRIRSTWVSGLDFGIENWAGGLICSGGQGRRKRLGIDLGPSAVRYSPRARAGPDRQVPLACCHLEPGGSYEDSIRLLR